MAPTEVARPSDSIRSTPKKMPPPMTAPKSVQSPSHLATPARPVTKQPKRLEVPSVKPAVEQVPIKIHPQLRSHCKSGPKDIVPSDITGPRMTRSGKKLEN